MPPRARTGVVAPFSQSDTGSCASVRRRRGDARRQRSASRTCRKHEACVRQRPAAPRRARRRRRPAPARAPVPGRRPRRRAGRPSPRRRGRIRRRARLCERAAPSATGHASVTITARASPSIAPSRMVSSPRRARGERRVVRDDDQRRAVGVHAVEQRGDLLAGRLIQLAGRLVGQQQARPVRQGAGDRHPLHLAARQLRRPMIGAVAEARRSRAARACAAGAAAPAAPASACGSSTFSAAVSIGSRKKRWNTKPICAAAGGCAPRRRARATSRPSKSSVAARGRVDASEDVQQRRLAAARRPAHGHVLALRDPQRHVAHRGHRRRPASETARDSPSRFDNRRLGHRHHLVAAASRQSAASRRSASDRAAAPTAAAASSHACSTRARAARRRRSGRRPECPASRSGSDRATPTAPARAGTARTPPAPTISTDSQQHAGHHARAREAERAQRGDLAEPLVDRTVSSTVMRRKPKNIVTVASTDEICRK